MESLTKYNYVAAGVHLAAALATAQLLQSPTIRKVQMNEGTYDKDGDTRGSRVDIPVKLKESRRVDLKPIVVAFFAITSVAHFIYATDFFGKGWYSTHIINFGWNPYRWVEYSITASLMIYLISAVSGTKDDVSAISNALITPGLMLSGFTTERALKQNALHDWSLSPSLAKPAIDAPIVLSNVFPAWILYGVHWYIILSNYSRLAKDAREQGRPLDKSVTFMVYSQLVFFSLFGIIQSYQVYRWISSREGRAEPSFAQYEKSYIVLSAVAKLALGGTVLYALRD